MSCWCATTDGAAPASHQLKFSIAVVARNFDYQSMVSCWRKAAKCSASLVLLTADSYHTCVH